MNEMMETIKTFDNKDLPIRHIPGPEGVRGRNSDNALILEKLGWEPTIKLADGLRVTYTWIKSQLAEVFPAALFSLCASLAVAIAILLFASAPRFSALMLAIFHASLSLLLSLCVCLLQMWTVIWLLDCV